MASPENDLLNPPKQVDQEPSLSSTPRRFGSATTVDTQEGELGDTGEKARKRTELVFEGPEVTAARIMLVRTAPIFEGLRDETIIQKLTPHIKFFNKQAAGRVLFDAESPDNGLGRAGHILITGKKSKIKVTQPDGKIITHETELPEHTTMGEQGFLGKARTATVTSLTEDGVFWRLDGPISSLNLQPKEELILRANLLAARGGEISSLNREIKMGSRPTVEAFPNLQTLMAEITETLGGPSEMNEDFVPVVPGHFFYLASGMLQVIGHDGNQLGVVKGPNIVQELIGAGQAKQTAKLKPIGPVRGVHVPCRTLIDSGHSQAPMMLGLADAAFNSKMTQGNKAVADARPEPTHYERISAWAKAFFATS